MAKRTATSDLNHDNWDREYETEEAGTFAKASEDAMKKRVFKVAKRRNPISQESEGKVNAFGGFAGFGSKDQPPATKNSFDFLKSITETPKTNGSTPSTQTDQEKDKKTEKNGETPEDEDKKLDEYYGKLKGLNECVSECIKKHVSENPLISLQPIFKDYEKYMADLDKLHDELLKKNDKPAASITEFKFGIPTTVSSSTTTTTTTASSLGYNSGPIFQFTPPASSLPKSSSTSSPASASTAGYTFGVNSKSTATVSSSSSSGVSSSSSLSFGDGKPPVFSFGAAPNGNFLFSSTVVKPAATTPEKPASDENNTGVFIEDEPPNVEVKPVVEEGHIYTIRCKVFVKKESSYGDRGVGNLYLKPVADSDKVQLIVRAETNLGNLLCNLILSSGIPIQRMGKKDVMLVCLPTPDTKPPPVPVLFRVKSPEDADDLLKVLKENQK